MNYFEQSPFQSPEANKNTRDPEAAQKLYDAYNSSLYGHLNENPSLADKEDMYSDESDRLFTDAAITAQQHNRNLDEHKGFDDGMMTVRTSLGDQDATVQRSKDWKRQENPGAPLTKIVLEPERVIGNDGAEIIIQKTLTEDSPGRWTTEETVVSGNENSLPQEHQPGTREMTLSEVRDKDSILNQSIDPEKQKDLAQTAQESHQVTQARADVEAAYQKAA